MIYVWIMTQYLYCLTSKSTILQKKIHHLDICKYFEQFVTVNTRFYIISEINIVSNKYYQF